MALTAGLTISDGGLGDPAHWHLDVLIRNEGPEPVTFSTATMLGSVAFELLDDRGRRVPLGPPPMPPADLATGLVELEPGASLPLRFQGNELLPDAPPPGRYRVRFAGTAPPLDGAWAGCIESPWVDVVADT